MRTQSPSPLWEGSARGLLVVGNSLGCLFAALLLIGSALTWLVLAFTFWTIEALIQSGLGAAIAVIIVGAWFGGHERVPARIGLSVGNAAVLVSFAANLVGPALASQNTELVGIVIYVGALLMLFGYTALAGGLARWLLRGLARLR